MKVIAPGKLLLLGAYAVLEGSEALVVAVDRYAVADSERLAPSSSREVRAAIGDAPAPALDVSALHQGTAKLGLGSSAAALVATLGARAAMEGRDPADPGVREGLFLAARRAHAEAQGGGSGVDVAASTFGGALLYRAPAEGSPSVTRVALPTALALRVFWSGQSARTSDLLDLVRRFARRDTGAYEDVIADLTRAVTESRAACGEDDLPGFVRAALVTRDSLAALGSLADAPIVPSTFGDLPLLAEREGAAFYPSGAGGGDVAVWLGAEPPSEAFLERAREAGISPVEVGLDRAGVRTKD